MSLYKAFMGIEDVGCFCLSYDSDRNETEVYLDKNGRPNKIFSSRVLSGGIEEAVEYLEDEGFSLTKLG